MATGVDELIVAVFPSRSVLTKALDHLMQLKDLSIDHAAIVAKADDGEVVILDDNIGPDEGGIAGGTLGAAMAALGLVQLGALALPGIGAIIALGAGALVGGLVGQMTGRFAANLVDFGFRHDQIDALAHQLQAGHAALVMQVQNPQTALPRLRDELKPYRAELVERLRGVGRASAV
jgi:uncharacterized membrane protein